MSDLSGNWAAIEVPHQGNVRVVYGYGRDEFIAYAERNSSFQLSSLTPAEMADGHGLTKDSSAEEFEAEGAKHVFDLGQAHGWDTMLYQIEDSHLDEFSPAEPDDTDLIVAARDLADLSNLTVITDRDDVALGRAAYALDNVRERLGFCDKILIDRLLDRYNELPAGQQQAYDRAIEQVTGIDVSQTYDVLTEDALDEHDRSLSDIDDVETLIEEIEEAFEEITSQAA